MVEIERKYTLGRVSVTIRWSAKGTYMYVKAFGRFVMLMIGFKSMD